MERKEYRKRGKGRGQGWATDGNVFRKLERRQGRVQGMRNGRQGDRGQVAGGRTEKGTHYGERGRFRTEKRERRGGLGRMGKRLLGGDGMQGTGRENGRMHRNKKIYQEQGWVTKRAEENGLRIWKRSRNRGKNGTQKERRERWKGRGVGFIKGRRRNDVKGIENIGKGRLDD